jgi:hypothetical protein
MVITRIMPLRVGKGCTESRVISDIIDYTVCLICRDELGMIFDTLAVTQMVTRREMNNSLQKTE